LKGIFSALSLPKLKVDTLKRGASNRARRATMSAQRWNPLFDSILLYANFW